NLDDDGKDKIWHESLVKLAETEKIISGKDFKTCLIIVVFPVPLGADIAISFPFFNFIIHSMF
ncbi:MAG: hypothetical protein IH949_01805, partial [Bacteroidetes bacterium]|nr:hypothetical protein [Bacteroidota bacterium]